MTTDKQNLTATAYVPHLLAVLGELTDYTAGVAVAQERTFEPVCVRMGISQDEFGKTDNNIKWTHRRIGFAMRQMRDKQITAYAAKGEWLLTEAGAAAAAQAAGRTPGTPVHDETTTAARALASDLNETNNEAGQVLQLRPRLQHPYSDDPYIRSLAILRTQCFGAFAPRSESCKACRLSQECITALDGRLAEIAADLDREEELEATKLAQKTQVQTTKDQSIDELINTFDEDQKKAKKNASSSKSDKYQPPPGTHVTRLAKATADNKCLHCSKTIPKGTANVCWVKNLGIVHEECLADPVASSV